MGRSRILQRVLDTWAAHNPDGGVHVSDSLRRWVADRVSPGTAYCSGRQAWCSRCGGTFPCGRDPDGRRVTCPHCGRTLTVDAHDGRKESYRPNGYVQELTAWGDLQVVRTYWWASSRHKGRAEEIEIFRTHDWVHDSEGRRWCFSRRISVAGVYDPDPWSRTWSRLRYRADAERIIWFTGWSVDAVYPVRRIRPWAALRGFGRGGMMGLDGTEVLLRLLRCPCFETVFKSGHRPLSKFLLYRPGSEAWWPQIKIALRAGFAFDDPDMWADYMRELRELGRDVSSPRWNAPDDLKAAHEGARRALARKRARDAAAEEMRRVAPDGKDNREYVGRVGAALGFTAEDGSLVIRPLQSVAEFREEGLALHHCVYSAAYYRRPHCLILDAAVDGRRTETIEIDTARLRIVQCRGPHNQDSEWHGRILSLMEASLPRLRKYVSNI